MPDLKSTRHRLKKFADWTGTVAPKTILDDEGAPTEEFRDYARREGLCLDWVFCNSTRSLALGYRRAHAGGAAINVQDRVDLLAKVSGLTAPDLQLEGGSVLVTDELMAFCKAAHADLQWLFSGDMTRLVEAYAKQSREMEPFIEAVRDMTDGEKRALAIAFQVANEEDLNIEDAVLTFKKYRDEQKAA